MSVQKDAADRLKNLVETNDPALVPTVYAEEATIWHNTDGIEISATQLAEILTAIRAAATCQVTVEDYFETDAGFIQVQTNKYTINNGSTAEFQAALVVDVDASGRISRVREYLDSVGLAPLLSALA